MPSSDILDTSEAEKFKLFPGAWYAADFISDDFSCQSGPLSRSPIRVDAVRPARSGHRVFYLSFYHANYPEGVREKIYTLKTIERGRSFILARQVDATPSRILLIYAIGWEWLQLHFGVQRPNSRESVPEWLSVHA